MSRMCLGPVELLGCCLLLACSSSPPTRYYALNAIPSTTPLPAAANQVAVRVVSDDLSTRLPAHWVSDPDEPPSAEPRRLLSIAITEFYGDEECRVVLRANWTLRNSNAGSEPNVRSELGSEEQQ